VSRAQVLESKLLPTLASNSAPSIGCTGVQVNGNVRCSPGCSAVGAHDKVGALAELAEAFQSFARQGIDHLQWVNPMTPVGIETLGAALQFM
jgi:hypothetical protein